MENIYIFKLHSAEVRVRREKIRSHFIMDVILRNGSEIIGRLSGLKETGGWGRGEEY